MKKIISILLAIMVLGCFGIEAKTTKKSGKKKSTASRVVVTKGETKQYGDYLTTQIFTVTKGKYKEKIFEYPIDGNQQLVDSIRKRLVGYIPGASSLFNSPELLLKKYTLLNEYGSKDEIERNAVIAFSNQNIITYIIDGYIQEYELNYPYTPKWGDTFLVENGKSFSKELIPDLGSLNDYIIKNVDEYVDDWVISDYGNNLRNYGFGGYIYILNDGIKFNEFIGMGSGLNYNGGLIEGIIPISQIIDVVSPDVQKFLK